MKSGVFASLTLAAFISKKMPTLHSSRRDIYRIGLVSSGGANGRVLDLARGGPCMFFFFP